IPHHVRVHPPDPGGEAWDVDRILLLLPPDNGAQLRLDLLARHTSLQASEHRIIPRLTSLACPAQGNRRVKVRRLVVRVEAGRKDPDHGMGVPIEDHLFTYQACVRTEAPL